MPAGYIWGWNSAAGAWVKLLVDASGHLQTDVLSQPDVAQTDPTKLKHLPHGYYAVGGTYLPFAVDSAGKLLLAIPSLQHLDDIDDVYVPSPTDEYLLYWDAPNSRWACRALVDADIPSAIARDAEVATAVSDHAALDIMKAILTAAGDLITASAASTPAILAIGSEAKVLTSISGLPSWQTPAAGGYTQGARAYHSANQAIPNETFTKLAFDTEAYDTDTIHDLVTNNGRLTCKTAGKYIIIGVILYAANATGVRYCSIILNVATYIGHVTLLAQSTYETPIGTSTLYDLNVNDYIQLQAWQDSGGSLNANAPYSLLMMQRVG